MTCYPSNHRAGGEIVCLCLSRVDRHRSFYWVRSAGVCCVFNSPFSLVCVTAVLRYCQSSCIETKSVALNEFCIGKKLQSWSSCIINGRLSWQSYLKVRLRKASCHRDHGGGERPRDANGGEELRDVWRQAKWNRPIGVQLTGGVVDVKAEIRDIQLPCVLECIKVKMKSRYSHFKETALISRSKGSHKTSSDQ